MKTPGLIGGIGPESTIEYYRKIVAAYRARTGDGSYPPLILNSIDMQRMLRMAMAQEYVALTAYLLGEVQRLAKAGADFGVLASNTPHVVFSSLRDQSPIPLISIVETACAEAKRLGLKRLGLFGTRVTMQGRFYPEVFEREGFTLITPSKAEQDFIHEKYMSELLLGIIRPDTRATLLKIAERLQAEEGIVGLILGGTELPLILDATSGARIPLLDTTQLHVDAIVDRMLS